MKLRRSLIIALGVMLTAAVRGQATEEYKVKAAFLYNFAKFVEWPVQSFKGSSDPFVIGVLGKNSFGDALTTAVSGKTLDGREFRVKEVADARQAAGCHILFISSSERKQLETDLREIGIPGVLTVGETDNFAVNGGVVGFKIEGGNVRFQINVSAAKRQQLHISAKLLSLAEIVEK